MSKPRRQEVIIIDSDSSDGEDQSVFSIYSLDHGNRPVNNSSANVEDLTTSLSRVVLAPDSQKKRRFVAGTRKYGKGGLDALSFDSDSDSSLEVFQTTFATKPRRMEDASTTSESVIEIEDSDSDKETDDESKAKSSTESPWTYDDTVDEYSLVSRGQVKMPDFRIPASLFNRLFDHQKDGVAWMAGLHSPGVGGLLGDDMGMGKTYMALTLLGGLMRDKTIRNGLIVAPLSVLRSWETEAEKVLKACVPRVRIYVVSSDIGKATRCKRLQDALECSSKRPHLVITTYGLVGSAPLDLCNDSKSWDYVVLDEAHKIKNPSAKVSKNIRRICRSEETRRLILTGTPIMNNLRELWALFDFATSGKVLSVQPRFVNRFSKPIEAARDKDATGHTMRIGEKANEELQQLLRPYFLQRLKIDFLADKLPTKSDFVVWTHISSKQRSLYEQYVDSGQSAVASVLSGESKSPLEAITWLKKLCGHPILVDKKYQGTAINFEDYDPDELIRYSSKLQVLVALIDRLRRDGHRTLIFSQSTRMLDIIERVLYRVRLSRIDGSTKEKDRQSRVDDFNSKSSRTEVMLLSTKAAGVGLTLCGADRCVVYDPSWNPAEDSQAVDRCYRIGQTKAVVVFRLIAAGTVEEKMYEKQVHKDGIRRAVMTSTGSATTRYFDRSELSKMFKLAPAGACEILERLKASGQGGSNLSGQTILSSHEGVVGVSSHDGLYTAKSLVTLVDEDDSPNKNPFSSNPDPSHPPSLRLENMGVDENKKPAEKVLGRSQRALLGKDEKENMPTRDAATIAISRESMGGNRTNIEDPQTQSRDNRLDALRRVDEMRASGKLVSALSLLMDLFEGKYKALDDKDVKMKVHERIALISNELGWL